jgi:hypothetical protein|tara:strand:+ start:169 stop:492 length:324 start_codon:yes stop_codon:yes gene_type:complete
MKWSVTVIALFVTVAINAQTESISIVQYTASFAEQVTLEDYKDYNSKTYFVSKSPDEFKNIRYYPTIVLYNDGEEELRIESGISLKLPEDWKEQLNEHIDLLLSQRF